MSLDFFSATAMKILQIIYESPGNPFGTGGAGIRAVEIYRRLCSRHDITLLCMRYPGAADHAADGVQYIFAGTESTSLTKSVAAYTLAAARYVRRHGDEFDVIVENFLPSTPFFCRLLTRTPVLLQVQGVMERHALRKFNPLLAVPMYLAESVYPYFYRDFIFVSDVTRDKVMGGRKFRSCRVIPNGINAELLTADAAEKDYILFFSRIDTYTKGLDLLMAAFARLHAEFPELRLVLAGYEFNRSDDLIRMLPPAARRRVEYAGFVSGEEKIRLLSDARLVVLPSRHESAPISILEAAACARPVVVSDIPELRFVAAEGVGVTFKSGSAEDLGDKLCSLLGDPGLRLRLGAAGRAYAGRYTWDAVAAEFENALQLTADGQKEQQPS